VPASAALLGDPGGRPGDAASLSAWINSLPPDPPKPNHVRQVEEIKHRLDLYVTAHESPEVWGGDPILLRAGAERVIARIFAQVFGVAPERRRRLALMRRIDALAGVDVPTPGKGGYLRNVIEGAHDQISDADLEGVVRVWSTRPGAKSNGDVSKWIALSRLIAKRWGDETKPATLAREYGDARKNRGR
jgi:hypothetical protein